MTSLTPTRRRAAWTASSGAALLTAGAGLGAFVTTQGAGATGELSLDQLIAVDREPPLVTVAEGINVGFGSTWAPVLLLLVCAAVAVRNRWAAFVLVAATVTGWLSVAVGKLLFARQRPPIEQVHALVRETGLDSYPSGHTAFAAALLAGIVLALRASGRSTRWAWVLGIPSVVLVAVSRLYLGAHYLGDVIGSLLFAGGSVLVLTGILAMLVTRGSTRPGPAWPARAAARER